MDQWVTMDPSDLLHLPAPCTSFYLSRTITFRTPKRKRLSGIFEDLQSAWECDITLHRVMVLLVLFFNIQYSYSVISNK